MNLFSQPQSYSDILNRIFVFTLVSGLVCTYILSGAIPGFKEFLDSINIEVRVGNIKGIKILYMLVPLVVAALFRIVIFHDRISDLFKIRKRFDLRYILEPLSQGVGFPTTGPRWQKLKENRDTAMTRTFYVYASFIDPKIDTQLVRTAADRWGWFWCTVEPQVPLIATAVILFGYEAYPQGRGILAVIGVLFLLGIFLWPLLKRGAKHQVAEILNNSEWKENIASAFTNLAGDEVLADEPVE